MSRSTDRNDTFTADDAYDNAGPADHVANVTNVTALVLAVVLSVACVASIVACVWALCCSTESLRSATRSATSRKAKDDCKHPFCLDESVLQDPLLTTSPKVKNKD